MKKEVLVVGVLHTIKYWPKIQKVLESVVKPGMTVAWEGGSELWDVEKLFGAHDTFKGQADMARFSNEAIRFFKSQGVAVVGLFEPSLVSDLSRRELEMSVKNLQRVEYFLRNQTQIQKRILELETKVERPFNATRNELTEYNRLVLSRNHFEDYVKRMGFKPPFEDLHKFSQKQLSRLKKIASTDRQRMIALREQHWKKILSKQPVDVVMVGSLHVPQVESMLINMGFSPKTVFNQMRQSKSDRKQVRKAYFFRKGQWHRTAVSRSPRRRQK